MREMRRPPNALSSTSPGQAGTNPGAIECAPVLVDVAGASWLTGGAAARSGRGSVGGDFTQDGSSGNRRSVSGRQITAPPERVEPDRGGITRKGARPMDTTTLPRRGVPPGPVPTMPLFLGAARSRVKRELAMSGATSRELDSYIDWASARAMMPSDEVLVRIVEHALVEYLKKDAAWQNERAEFIQGARSEVGGSQAGPAAGADRPDSSAESRGLPPLPPPAAVTGKGA